VVGLGPGDERLLPPMAREAIESARTIVGYGPYIDMVPPELLQDKTVVSTGMTREVDRCRRAVAAALSGSPTAVVCSGDPGVYAMAGLVLELLETMDPQGLIEPEIIPGIPALTAAAAILGGPLTHDFASVSLSDLLTPWDLIEKRIECAAQGDFVLAIYNPRSKKRDWQLARARDILLKTKSPDTPVGLVRQAWRSGGECKIMTLQGLDPAMADMLSILIIGNSRTRIINNRLVTPRGYFDKYPAPGP